MRWTLLLPLFVIATPLAAQEMSRPDPAAVGLSEVLNHMNRENARQLHRDAGMPPPDFGATERRMAAGRQAGSARHAEGCAALSRRRAEMTEVQYRRYKQVCP